MLSLVPQPKVDTVTLTAMGKQAAQQTVQYSPEEEQEESSGEKGNEAQAGKK
jgi:hypothetical protein